MNPGTWEPLPGEAEHQAPDPQCWNWVDVALISLAAVLIFGLGFAAVIFTRRFWPVLGAQTPQLILIYTIALACLECIALLGAVYLAGLRRRGRSWEAVGLRLPSGAWWRTAGLIGLAVIPLSGLITLLIQVALGLPLENTQSDFLAPTGFSWLAAVNMVVLGGVMAPFAEEVFFRGVIFQWLRNRIGFWAAALLSSLFFGVMHGEVSVGGAAAVLGLILAWVYEKSRSLWPSFLIHAINNSVKIIVLYAMLASGIEI